MPPAAFDVKRLHTLFVALHRSNEGERNAAAGAFYRYFVDHRRHPDEFTISDGREDDLITRNQRVIDRLQTELIRVQNQNMFFRRHAASGLLADAIKSGEVDYQWFALEDLARERLGDALPRHWRSIVAKQAEVSSYQMHRWERGIAPIPDTVFEALRAMPALKQPQGRRHKRRQSVKTSQDKYVWPEAVLTSVVDLWLRGANKQAILAAAEAGAGVGVISDGMITSKIEHSMPPDLLKARVRPAGEPIDWPELWLLGATLLRGTASGKRQRGWRTAALAKLGLNKSFAPPADLNAGTTQAAIDGLRNEYVLHNLTLSQEKVKAVPDLYQPLLDMMLSVGAQGATRADVKSRIGDKHLRRISEMQKRLMVFDSGLKGRSEEVIYVHQEFADAHPLAWQAARRNFSNDPATAD